jgi:isopenicillin-N N-acyltransferase-like protein
MLEGEFMKRNNLRKIIISGNPLTRGRRYGEKAKSLVDKSVGRYQKAFKEASAITWKKALDFSRSFVKRIKEYDETLLEEMKGLAKGSGRAFEEILTINLRTEILFGLKKLQAKEGCTSFCALSEITREGNTILGQNWDYRPFATETMFLLQVNQDQGPDILTLVEAGQLARMGMNSAGLGFCNNYLECETDGKNMDKGIPTPLIRRRALNQESYHEVVGTIIHTPRSFSGNYLVGTAEGEGDATDIEATPETIYFLFPKDGLIVHSNHIKGAGPGYVGALRMGLENSLYRDRRLETLLRREIWKIGPEEIIQSLKDHFGYPYSICRHVDKKKPWYDQWQTNASVIMDLTDQVMWVSAGPPCQNEYQRFTFDLAD